MRTKTKWSPGPGVKILGVALTDDDSWVVSAAGPAFGICPDCGRRTRNRHCWFNRSLQDLPVQGGVIVLRVHKSFSVDCGLNFAVTSRPAPGSVRVFDRAGEGAELVCLASSRQDAELWLQCHGYPNAVLEPVSADTVSADTVAADVVEGRAA